MAQALVRTAPRTPFRRMASSSYACAERSIAAVQQAVREERQIGLLMQRDAEVADPAAVERIMAGLETRNRLLNPKECVIVAYHEMGQAPAASDPVRPQQRALGHRRGLEQQTV
jgi:hypothetical protein